jgi:dephospho-CoA kinase
LRARLWVEYLLKRIDTIMSERGRAVSRWEGKYVIGLTGNIGVGKSVVRQMLQHLGAYTIDADELTHQVMAPNAPAYQPVVEMFGKFVLDDAGKINRALLGAVVFSVPEALVKLEQIIHPIVNQFTGVLITRAKQRVVVVEAIKLIEGGMGDAVDAIWVVDAPAEQQLRRLAEKRKMSIEEARKRMASQSPQAQKIARASVVIKNDGTVEETWKQVQASWNDTIRMISGQQARQGVGSNAPTPPQAPARPQPPRATGTTGQLRQPPPAPPTTPAKPTGTLPGTAAANAPTTPSPLIQPIQARPPMQVVIRRGMPSNAEGIARFIGGVTGKNISRADVMAVFGPKSYLVGEDKDKNIVAVIGWQVENLITRTDELYIGADTPRDMVIPPLLKAMEDAATQLQSEVSFIFLPANTPPDILGAIQTAGYKPLVFEELKMPAWREAAREVLGSGTGVRGMLKQLRADMVMKPI